MLLIADSGSTKCDWLLLSDSGEVLESHTMGLNPFFHSAEFMAQKMLANPLLESNRNAITEIQYYGAGCSSPDRNNIVEVGLKTIFPNASEIDVAEDMQAAALATCKGEKGIVCILGTGSNSCYFDGTKINKKVPALGYVLGDEGSGAFIGKQLIKHYLYKTLPHTIESTIAQLGFSNNDLLSKVYREPHANVFLASLVKEISMHNDHPFIQKIIKSGFKEFAEIHIQCFENYQSLPVHFVGSIAYYYIDMLTIVSAELDFKVGKIVKQPIKELAERKSKV